MHDHDDAPLEVTPAEAVELMTHELAADRSQRESDTPPLGLLAAKLRAVATPPVTDRGTVAGMTPTDEQQAGLDIAVRLFALRSQGFQVLALKAGAGAGKTAELRMMEQVLTGRGQGTAFNSSLVADNAERFVRASWKTTHGLAFRAVGCRYKRRLDGPRIKSEQVARQLGIEAMHVLVEGQEQPRTLQAGFLAGQVLVAVKKFAQSADPAITAAHFRYIDGIDQPVATEDGGLKRSYANNEAVKEYLLPFAEAAWADLTNPAGTLPYNHDYYVKEWQLGTGEKKPYIPCDYLLLDEYQDTAEVFIDILRQQTHALLILVGDDNQRIYEWRNAKNAADYFPTAEVSWLSQSFRFGQAAADVANSVLRTLEVPTDLVMKGLPTIPSRVAAVANPRCILCRTNAGAVATVLGAIKEGKHPHLVGGGTDVVAWVKAARDLQQKRGTSHPELCCFSSWQEVVEYSATDEGEDLALMCRLVKEFGVDAILGALEDMPEEQDADLVVSTAHKSKGREWPTVRLAADFPTADRLDDAGRRLLYVACTRAQEVLDLSCCPAFIGGESNHGISGAKPEFVPGIPIKYTSPMPSPEALETYRDARAGKAKTPKAPTNYSRNGLEKYRERMQEAEEQGDKPTSGTGATGEYTWANIQDGWRVRGLKGQEGKRVTVTRKNGTTSQVTLGKVVHKIGELWFYSV